MKNSHTSIFLPPRLSHSRDYIQASAITLHPAGRSRKWEAAFLSPGSDAGPLQPPYSLWHMSCVSTAASVLTTPKYDHTTILVALNQLLKILEVWAKKELLHESHYRVYLLCYICKSPHTQKVFCCYVGSSSPLIYIRLVHSNLL